jgi:hypothetical protein
MDAPAVQFVPLDYRRTRQYSGYTGLPLREGEQWNGGYFPKGVLDPAAVQREFGRECFLRPVMSPGDAIIASNWIIHSSYRTPTMKKGRTSVEVRFIGSQLDIKPAPEKTLRSRIAAAFG